MKAVLILNPTSGAAGQTMRDEQEEQILTVLKDHAIEAEVMYTSPEDPGTAIAREAARQGIDIIIAAGGDGTIHAVAAGLIGSQSILGIIPVGTMNNIARSLHIPEEIAGACEIIVSGQTHALDVGQTNGHIFLEVTGIGLEAALFPAAEEMKSPGLLSTLHGAMTGLITLFTFRATRFTISFDGKRKKHVQALQISICNSPYYGARLQFAPDALMDDGFLDVLIYRKFSKLKYIQHAIAISQGKRSLQPRISRRRVKSIHVTADSPVEIHVDGEIKGNTPAEITVQPEVLRVRVPASITEQQAKMKTHQQRFRKWQKQQRQLTPTH